MATARTFRALVFLACTVVAAVHASVSVAQARMEVLVSRGADGIELYLAMPTEEALRSSGLTEVDLLDADGFVDFDGVSANGARLTDLFWQGVVARLDGQDIAFAPLSLMVHPLNRPMPFRTPVDAAAAIEVCTYVEGDMPLSATRLYVGLVATPGTSRGALALEFPAALSAGLNIRARDFTSGLLQDSRLLEPGAGGVLRFEDVAPRDDRTGWLVPVALVTIVLALIALLALRWRVSAASGHEV
ncbi:MAG: hypothetical protein AAGA06_03900 [Pseudomonadota bacterium]